MRFKSVSSVALVAISLIGLFLWSSKSAETLMVIPPHYVDMRRQVREPQEQAATPREYSTRLLTNHSTTAPPPPVLSSHHQTLGTTTTAPDEVVGVESLPNRRDSSQVSDLQRTTNIDSTVQLTVSTTTHTTVDSTTTTTEAPLSVDPPATVDRQRCISVRSLTATHNSTREDGCAQMHSIKCELGKRGRALVLYVLKTFDEDSTAVHPEAWGAKLFSRFGVVQGAGTAVFDQVDTVVVRMREDITEPRIHKQKGNITLIDVIGNTVRDGYSCAQARGLEFLSTRMNLSSTYKFAGFVHSGVHGPFHHRHSPFWLDVLAMGGQDVIDDTTPPMMVSPSLFVDSSNIVGMHSALLEHHAVYLASQCPSSIPSSNATTIPPAVWWLHSLVRGVTLRTPAWGQQYVADSFPNAAMPALTDVDIVCSAMFSKHSGPFSTAVDDERHNEHDFDERIVSLTKHQFSSPHSIGLLHTLLAQGPRPFIIDIDSQYGVVTKVGLRVPLAPPPSGNEVGRQRIAAVFFGLVKNVSPEHLAALRKHIADPLRGIGDVDVFLHTFAMNDFRNPRNAGEGGRVPINQTASINAIQNVFENCTFTSKLDPPEVAHKFFGPTSSYLKYGGSWEEHSFLSVHYYLRQQFSLIRATELWTGNQYTTGGAQNESFALPSREYDCVVFLRPDLIYSAFPKHALEAMCHRSPHHRTTQRDIVVPSVQYGGFHDRTAFGSPVAMLLYGLRGLRLREYVAARQPVHAETFLARYLCENDVTVHLAHWSSRRLRSGGEISDVANEHQKNDYYLHQIQNFGQHHRAHYNTVLRRNGVLCVPRVVWA